LVLTIQNTYSHRSLVAILISVLANIAAAEMMHRTDASYNYTE
jgi:hypothetical protein